MSTITVSWPREDVLAACRAYGPLVTPIEGIDTCRLLAAMAYKESSLGDNCTPKYEPRYDVGGKYASNPEQAAILARYGKLAAYSYGPLQVMLVNTGGCSPMDMNTDLGVAMRSSLRFLNHQIAHFQPTTVEQIGMIWNGGHIMHPPEEVPNAVQDYVKQLESNYEAAEMWLAKG